MSATPTGKSDSQKRGNTQKQSNTQKPRNSTYAKLTFFAFVSFVVCSVSPLLASTHNISLKESSTQGVNFVFRTPVGAESGKFMVAVPAGMELSLFSARTFGAHLMPHDIRFESSSGAVVEIGSIKLARGWRIASLIVRPRQGDIQFDSVAVDVRFIKAGRTGAVPGESNLRRAEAGFFTEMFSENMINFEEAVNWNGPALVSGQSPDSAHQLNPFDYATNWYKLSVTTDGFTRVSATDLGIAGVSSSSVRIFYSGGEPLSPLNINPRPAFAEIPLKFFDGGDGIFDAGDFLLFYGESINRWQYNAGVAPSFVRNVYTNNNYYWLTVDDNGFPGSALRMTQLSGSTSGATGTAVASARRQVRLESDVLLNRDGSNEIRDYYNWYWSSGSNHNTSALIAGAITDPTVDDTTRYLAHIIAGGVTLTADGLSASQVTNFSQHYWSFVSPPLSPKITSFNFSMSPFFSSGPYFDYLEIDYLADLSLSQNALAFSGPSVTERREFIVNGAGSALITLNIDDPRNPVELTGGTLQSGQSGQWRFAADLDSLAPNRFFVADPSSASNPASLEAITTSNFRADTLAQIDYFLIGPRVWEGALQGYISHRESYSGINASYIAVEDLYDEFGFGSPDPSAIRDFLKYAFETYPSPAPSVVLFVGDGSYDFRNITGSSLNIVPPYTSPLDRGFASDDHYVYFDKFAFLDSDSSYIPNSTLGVDMVPARWPVRSLADLNRVIDKTIAYETEPEFGEWRNEIILLADDEFGQFVNESVHVEQTEELDRGFIPRIMQRDKIYLWDYPLNSLSERPTVNDLLVRSINEGASIVNYVGHGNPSLFAHERVFTLDNDVPRLQNGKRLPMFFTASCSIGFFDSPETEGMAEVLMRMAGGAIAVVSATRLVYSSANAEFNRDAFAQLFGSQNLTMAQAVFAAKLNRQNASGSIDNDRRYSFFGDPYLKLARPEYGVTFTALPDSLVALEPTVVEGVVSDSAGAPISGFNGTAQITISDSKTERNYKVLNSAGDVSADMRYSVSGPRVFSGSVPVVNGYFSVTFIPSLDIGFGGADARISVYLDDSSTDAVGVVDSVLVGSTIPATTDTQGPEISLAFEGRSAFASGDPIGPSDKIQIILSDTSGINLSQGFGHSITLMIDNDVTQTFDMTNDFSYDPESFRRGATSHQLSGLTPGDHIFTVKAWDNANNSTTLEFSGHVSGSLVDAVIQNLLNYPNPMSDNTEFYFTLSSPAERMTMQIFTLSGIKIFESEESNLPASYHEKRFAWNGRDFDGDAVANGVYLYKAVAYPAGQGETVEEFGKIIISK